MKFNKNDEYYTLADTVHLLIKNVPIPRHYTIWCPFDDDSSEFVKVFKMFGYNVINTHIKNGQDFLKFNPNFDYDVIISNPPFSLKTEIIERIKILNTNFILLFGIQSLSVSSFCSSLSELNIGFFIPIKRVCFKNIDGVIKSPSFQSVFIHNLGKNQFLI